MGPKRSHLVSSFNIFFDYSRPLSFSLHKALVHDSQSAPGKMKLIAPHNVSVIDTYLKQMVPTYLNPHTDDEQHNQSLDS
ncbi:hypothetical protein ES703_96830 [subsurface metagenome]